VCEDNTGKLKIWSRRRKPLKPVVVVSLDLELSTRKPQQVLRNMPSATTTDSSNLLVDLQELSQPYLCHLHVVLEASRCWDFWHWRSQMVKTLRDMENLG